MNNLRTEVALCDVVAMWLSLREDHANALWEK